MKKILALKIPLFWDMMSCRWVFSYQHFGEVYCLITDGTYIPIDMVSYPQMTVIFISTTVIKLVAVHESIDGEDTAQLAVFVLGNYLYVAA
jgi:hypothetical protein